MPKQPLPGFPSLNKSRDVLVCKCGRRIAAEFAGSERWNPVFDDGKITWACAMCHTVAPDGSTSWRKAEPPEPYGLVKCGNPCGCDSTTGITNDWRLLPLPTDDEPNRLVWACGKCWWRPTLAHKPRWKPRLDPAKPYHCANCQNTDLPASAMLCDKCQAAAERHDYGWEQ